MYIKVHIFLVDGLMSLHVHVHTCVITTKIKLKDISRSILETLTVLLLDPWPVLFFIPISWRTGTQPFCCFCLVPPDLRVQCPQEAP